MYKMIYFLGPEGVGKTTLIKMLINHMAEKHYKARYVHIRSNQLFTYVLRKIILASTKQEGRFLYNFRDLLLLLDFVSVVILSLVHVIVPILLGYTIVAERYVIDTMVPLYHLECINCPVHPRIRGIYTFLLRLVPSNSLFLVLRASNEVLMAHCDNRGSQPESYLWTDLQRRVFDLFVGDMEVDKTYVTIGREKPEHTFEEIKTYLRDCLVDRS